MTTIVCFQKDNELILAGDGQVTSGTKWAVKDDAKKIRHIKGNIWGGFAGSVTDAFALRSLFEKKLSQFNSLSRAVIETSLEWRTGKMYKQLNASLIVTDGKEAYELDGVGGVSSMHKGILTIGSGSSITLPVLLTLSRHTEKTPKEIVKIALDMAGELDVFSNTNHIFKHFVDGELIKEASEDEQGE